MPVSLISIEKRWGTTMAIFSVSLADKTQVFMCAHTTPYENEKRGVVIVDARKFLKLWRAEPPGYHWTQAQGNPDTWYQDRKFTSATEGFSLGFANSSPNMPGRQSTQNRHPMPTMPVTSVCNAVIAISLRR